jgi:RNA polymerase sigma-70 factor, ECF subfamily
MDDSNFETLQKGLAEGDADAFAALYDRFGRRLYATARRMLGSHQDAEDAVQEVFAAVVRSRKRLIYVRDLDAYMFTALRRACAGSVKHREKRPGACAEMAELAVARENAPGTNPENERLSRAVTQLSDEQREVISLKIDAGLTFAQIGSVLGVNPNTAASRYRYGLEKLRRLMENPHEET